MILTWENVAKSFLLQGIQSAYFDGFETNGKELVHVFPTLEGQMPVCSFFCETFSCCNWAEVEQSDQSSWEKKNFFLSFSKSKNPVNQRNESRTQVPRIWLLRPHSRQNNS